MSWVNWVFLSIGGIALLKIGLWYKEYKRLKAKVIDNEIKSELADIEKKVETLSLTDLIFKSNERLKKWRESRNSKDQ